MESRLADALDELQKNTIEMERNRVIPELIGVYNAENAVHDVLKLPADMKYTTKMIGTNNKRVITAFNPSNSIQNYALDEPESDPNNNHILSIAGPTRNREHLDKPLEWDRNWMWDY